MPRLKKLFISHSHRDEPLASAFKVTLTKIFSGVQVAFSSDKQAGSGVQGGENWIEWIHQQMLDCQESLLLLTPYSIQKPWPMWEAGAVFGIVLSAKEAGSGGDQLTKQKPIPIRIGISQESMPGPLLVTHAYDGTHEDGLSKLLGELMKRYNYEHETDDVIADVTARGVAKLGEQIRSWLADAPALVTEGTVVEWCARIERLKAEGRSADVSHLHRWIRLMYDGPDKPGADADAKIWKDKRDRPWDLRIHLRLGESYAESKQFKPAIREYELASELSPLDVFVLHGLAMSQLGAKDLDATRVTIDRILKLDPVALEWNPEVAGLEGRYWKDMARAAEAAGKPAQANDSYRRSLKAYQAALDVGGRVSYYMADNVGQLSLKLGELESARAAYEKALVALEGEKQNVWSLATEATAKLVLGRDAEALTCLRSIAALTPKPKDAERESIIGGLSLLRDALGKSAQDYASWLDALGR